MKLILVLAATVALVAMPSRAAEENRREKVRKAIHDYRVESQNFHIDKLIKEVHDLERQYKKLSPIPDKTEIFNVMARIWNQEENHCPEGKGHVPCFGAVPECVSELFICDGHKDCKNGADESAIVCSDEPYRVGSTLTGITSWSDCITHRPHLSVITITSNYKPKAYPSQVYVKAVLSMELDEHSHVFDTHNMKGYWNPGKRALVLFPDSEKDEAAQGYGVFCHFNQGSNKVADCKIGMAVSKHVCATFRGSRP